MINVQNERQQTFLAECSLRLEKIEKGLLARESAGARLDGKKSDEIEEEIRSIRSGAEVFELGDVAALSRAVEHAFAAVAGGKAAPSGLEVNVLLRGVERLRRLTSCVREYDRGDTAFVLRDLYGISGGLPESAENAGKGLQALLVEDDFSSRLLLQTFLSRHGECHVAVNGVEAVEAFRNAWDQGRRYDLICMDIMMPEMDGREAVRRIRQIEEDAGVFSSHGTRIVMITAVNDLREVMRCFHELCDGYLLKPIDLGKLTEILKKYGLLAKIA